MYVYIPSWETVSLSWGGAVVCGGVEGVGEGVMCVIGRSGPPLGSSKWNGIPRERE